MKDKKAGAYSIRSELLKKIEQFCLGNPNQQQQQDNNKTGGSANASLPSLERLKALEKETECPNEAKMVGLLLRLLSKE